MLDRHRVLETRDFEEHRANAFAAAPEIAAMVLAENAAFRGEIAEFPFATGTGATVLRSSSSTPGLCSDCHPTEDVRVVIPTTASFQITIASCVRILPASTRAALMPAGGGRAIAGAGHFWELRFERQQVMTAMRLFDCDAAIGALLDDKFLLPQLAGLQQVADQVRHIVRSIDADIDGLDELPQFRAAHEQLLRLRVAHVLAEAAAPERRPAIGRSRAALNRALEYIDAHAPGEIDLAALARHVGLSLRSLQMMFRRDLDSTIVQFIRERRLTIARERLESTNSDQTVTEIATASGFGHMSDFARLYRERFGELPSETRRRSCSRRT